MKLIRLEEICQHCGVNKEVIIHYIEETWIMPVNKDEYIFDEEDLARIYLIQELKEEFGVNDESMPIILSLLDQLNRLHLEIQK